MAEGSIRIEVLLDTAKLDSALKSMGGSVTRSAQAALDGVTAAAQSTTAAMAETAAETAAAGTELNGTAQPASDAAGALDTLTRAAEAAADAARNAADAAENMGDAAEQAGKKSGKSAEEWAKAADRAKKLDSALDKVQKTAVIVATAVLGLATAAAKMGSDFEAAMSEVGAISGATGEDFDALKAKAKEMGATTKFSATEAAEGLKYMAMAGWNTEQMLSGLDGIMNLAAASGEALGSVSDIVTDALTAFGLAAEDSSHFADVLAQASSRSNTNVALMGATFKYVAPVAGSLGYSVEDVAVAIGLMANAGIKGEQAGTALRAMFSRLVDPPKDAAEAMDRLDLAITNADGAMRPLTDVLRDLRAGFDGLSESEKAQTASALAGTEAMSGLLAIVSASDSDFIHLTNEIENAAGAAENMASVMQDNLQGDVTILKSALEGLGITVYESLQKPLREAAQGATEAVNTLAEAFDTPKLRQALDRMGEALANLAVSAAELATKVLPPLIEAFAWMAEHLGDIVPLWAGLTAAVKGYHLAAEIASKATGTLGAALQATPWGMVAAAVGVAVAAIGALAVAAAEAKPPMAEYRAETQAMVDDLKDCTGAIEKNTEAFRETTQVCADEADALRDADTRLRVLARQTNRTAGETEEMYLLIDQLNAALPGLNQSYDEQTQALSATEAATWKLIEAKKQEAMASAAQERMQEVAKDALELQSAQKKTEEELAKAQAERARQVAAASAAQDEYNRHQTEYALVSLPYKTALDEANAALAATDERIFALTAAQVEQAAQAQQLAAEMDELALQYGRAAEAADGSTGSAQAHAAALQEQAAAYEEVYAAVEKSVDGLFQLTDAVDKVEVGEKEGADAIDKLTESLEGQARYMEQYAENFEAAANRTGVAVDEGLLDKLSDGSQESARLLAAIAQAGDDEIQKLNDAFQKSEEGKDALITAVTDMRTGATDELKAFVADARTIGSNVAQGLIDGMDSRTADVAAAATRMAEAGTKAMRRTLEVRSPSRVFKKIGAYAAEGFIVGMESAEGRLVKTVEELGDEITKAALSTTEKKYELVTALEQAELARLYDEIERLENTKITKKNKSAVKAELAAVKEREKVLEKLRKAYDKAYEEIMKKQESFSGKLATFGKLVDEVELTDLWGNKETGYRLADLKKEVEQLRIYGSLLDQIREKGAPQSLLDEIADMGVEDGTNYMTLLLSQSDSDFEEYMRNWNLKQEEAERIATAFYQDQVDTLKENFTDKVTEQFTDASVDALLAGQKTGKSYLDGIISALDPSKVQEAVSAAQGAAFRQAEAGSAPAGASNTTTNNSTVNQTVNFNQPVQSPAQTARQLERAAKELANGR